MLYRFVLRPLLYALPPELAHALAFGALRLALALPPVRALLRAILRQNDPALAIDALGLKFPSPVGLAAGFDKDARGYEALGAAGFGFVEVGTITGEPQPGNPRPRLFRLVGDRALVNRMGFNNDGAERAARRLDRGRRRTRVGVNIGKSKIAAEEHAVEDYVRSTRLLARHADYFVVNVSSPNTPGLRNLQAVEKLEPLLRAVRQSLDAHARKHVPLLVKIAPDLADADVDAVADLALALGLDGIIATNTTVRRDDLNAPPEVVAAMGSGGLSGPPLRQRSFEVLRRLRQRVDRRVTLISVGGIEDGSEAFRRIKAGASLVQIYTAYIYEGPALPVRIAREMLAAARKEGFATIAEAIGADAS
jgi:dihydroorotate dehydrogenase